MLQLAEDTAPGRFTLYPSRVAEHEVASGNLKIFVSRASAVLSSTPPAQLFFPAT